MGKFLGGILLIIGTTVGAGILALPVTAAQAGFVHSTILLFTCWISTTISALLILEVNLYFPENSNLITMAKGTLGRWGEIISWLAYLMLLYALMSAYIAGGGDVVSTLFSKTHPLNLGLGAIIFTLVLGCIVYSGTRSVDYVNRTLMSFKLVSFFIMLVVVLLHVNINTLFSHPHLNIFYPVMVMMTSFGYSIIIPTLRTYFKSDVKKLRRVVLIGSIIPLILYMIWDLAILGTLPFHGKYGLSALLHSSHTVSGLMTAINESVNNSISATMSRLFTSISVLTSFLAVALSLSDFWADGLKIKKKGKSNIFIFGLTFLPPLVLVLFFPQIFVLALQYAGICCVILLGIFPILMAWRGRYVKAYEGEYQLFGGKILLALSLLLTTALAILGVVYS